MRSGPLALVVWCAAAESAVAQIDFRATVQGDLYPFVVLDITITDNGGATDCTSFGVLRRAVYPCGGVTDVVFCIPRQIGTTTTHQLFDQPAQHTSYYYEVGGFTGTGCVNRSDSFAFGRTFDPSGWGFPIAATASVGPGPTPLLHGEVLGRGDPCCLRVRQCADSCFPDDQATGAGIWQYEGTGAHLLMYGSLSWAGNCCGWVPDVSQAQEQTCTIAVMSATWSSARILYR